jgi:hypothetical protein
MERFGFFGATGRRWFYPAFFCRFGALEAVRSAATTAFFLPAITRMWLEPRSLAPVKNSLRWFRILPN